MSLGEVYPFYVKTGVAVFGSSIGAVTYDADEFGFGEVYFSDNGTATDAFFANLDNMTAFVFAPNFYGIGLPEASYNLFTDYLFNLTSNSSCSSETGGFCTIL